MSGLGIRGLGSRGVRGFRRLGGLGLRVVEVLELKGVWVRGLSIRLSGVRFRLGPWRFRVCKRRHCGACTCRRGFHLRHHRRYAPRQGQHPREPRGVSHLRPKQGTRPICTDSPTSRSSWRLRRIWPRHSETGTHGGALRTDKGTHRRARHSENCWVLMMFISWHHLVFIRVYLGHRHCLSHWGHQDCRDNVGYSGLNSA